MGQYGEGTEMNFLFRVVGQMVGDRVVQHGRQVAEGQGKGHLLKNG